MFFVLCTLALLVPFASAFTLTTPTMVTSGGTFTVNWTASAGDPSTFSLELSNPAVFHNALGIANNIDTSLGTLSIDLSIVPPGSGYVIQAVQINNINAILGMTGDFDIGATVTSSATPTSSGLSSGASAASSVMSVAPLSSSAFGVTMASSSGARASGASGAASGTATSHAPSGTAFNGNGAGFQADFGMGSLAIMALGALAAGAVAL